MNKNFCYCTRRRQNEKIQTYVIVKTHCSATVEACPMVTLLIIGYLVSMATFFVLAKRL